MMEYNTQREPLKIPEYGRHVQMLIQKCMEITDRDERTRMAHAIIGLMAQQNPQMRNVPEYQQKLWDHLFIISDYKLEIESPYPAPEPPSRFLKRKRKVDYPKNEHKYHFYGSNIELLIAKILEIYDEEARAALIKQVAAYMRHCFRTYNDDKISDDVVVKHLAELSKGQIIIDRLPDPVNTRNSPERTHNPRDFRKFKNRNFQKRKQRQ